MVPGIQRTAGDLVTCTQALATATCSDLLANRFPDACAPKPGTTVNGAACGSNWQCQSTYCARMGECGVCGPLARRGRRLHGRPGVRAGTGVRQQEVRHARGAGRRLQHAQPALPQRPLLHERERQREVRSEGRRGRAVRRLRPGLRLRQGRDLQRRDQGVRDVHRREGRRGVRPWNQDDLRGLRRAVLELPAGRRVRQPSSGRRGVRRRQEVRSARDLRGQRLPPAQHGRLASSGSGPAGRRQRARGRACRRDGRRRTRRE